MRFMPLILLATSSWLVGVPAAYVSAKQPSFAEQFAPTISLLADESRPVSLKGNIKVEIDGKPQSVTLDFSRFDDQQFDLKLAHPDYAVSIVRRNDFTAMLLPLHKSAFVGSGAVDPKDHIAPQKALERLISSGSSVATYAPLFSPENASGIAALAETLLSLKRDESSNAWHGKEGLSLSFDTGQSLHIETQGCSVALKIDAATKLEQPDFQGMNVYELPRAEIERQLCRGVRRTLEIFTPSRLLTHPLRKEKIVDGGKLQWIGHARVVQLHGTPEQIGFAHGELLRDEATRCIDSVLYAFGTVQTIRTGKWFRKDLEAAYARLQQHIPEDHKIETRALADALGMDRDLVECLNVFPELFHCSGFAVFDSATKDGKLYHGRVLDYMTTIGLQDSATAFIVAPNGKIPFANVGYAGFIGSVTGMNAKAISLGEMGGGGEGQWDGVPMATLMRRALEECDTLDEVKTLWQSSPRTCEYYYVFADGKTNEAVGVAALPESIEFIDPGQSHPRLGEGIEDAVVLSAGDRLAKLRERVQTRHGSIDADIGMWLMSRPVAMESNLHNVLFVPADGVMYVANATHDQPAAETQYVRININELLKSMP